MGRKLARHSNFYKRIEFSTALILVEIYLPPVKIRVQYLLDNCTLIKLLSEPKIAAILFAKLLFPIDEKFHKQTSGLQAIRHPRLRRISDDDGGSSYPSPDCLILR